MQDINPQFQINVESLTIEGSTNSVSVDRHELLSLKALLIYAMQMYFSLALLEGLHAHM